VTGSIAMLVIGSIVITSFWSNGYQPNGGGRNSGLSYTVDTQHQTNMNNDNTPRRSDMDSVKQIVEIVHDGVLKRGELVLEKILIPKQVIT